MRQKITRFVELKRVERFILVIIVLNTIVLGLETSETLMSHVGTPLEILNHLFIGIYVVEAILKLIAYRGDYFKSGWNCFDFLIVVTSLIPVGGIFSGLRILRVFRGLRAFRLISGLKPLRRIVGSILRSLPGVSWTVLLMMIVYYVYSIIGIRLFRPEFPEEFGTLGASFTTLFELTTLEGWQDLVKPITALHPTAWLYFLTFIVIASFILLNVVLGIVVDSLDLQREDEKQDAREELLAGGINADEAIILEIESLQERLTTLDGLLRKKVSLDKEADKSTEKVAAKAARTGEAHVTLAQG